MTKIIKNQAISSKNSHVIKKSLINKGKWTEEENKKFEKLIKQMYCGEISKRELYEKFRTRSQKQILSKLNKRKYLYEKEYGLFVSKEKLESFTTSLHTLKRLGVNEHKSYVDLYDDQRGKTIRIEKVFLTDLIKANLNKDSTTLRIDEKIIKTLLMAKSCILAMKSLVEEEKNLIKCDEYVTKTLLFSDTRNDYDDHHTTIQDTPFVLENHLKLNEDSTSISRWNDIQFVESEKHTPIEGKINSSIKLTGYLRSNISVSKFLFDEKFLNTNNFIDEY